MKPIIDDSVEAERFQLLDGRRIVSIIGPENKNTFKSFIFKDLNLPHDLFFVK